MVLIFTLVHVRYLTDLISLSHYGAVPLNTTQGMHQLVL